jgi:outer membrane protein OmpA-like peptidoglycan-associated protein
MTHRFASVALTLSLLTTSSARAQSPDSLIVNGSFEDGPVVESFLNLTEGNRSLPGWVVTGEGVDYVSVVPEDAPPLHVRESAEEILVELGSEVLFDTGKFELKPEATDALRGLVGILQKYPNAPVVIEGHTDSVGSAQSNQVLSENRAAAVRQWLAGNGIPASRLSTEGFGATVPIAPNETPEGRQRNRRVEIRVQK